MDEKCGNCKFYDRVDGEHGLCSRYPPVVTRLSEWCEPCGDMDSGGWTEPKFGFPEMVADDVCGEFKPKGEKK